MAVVVSPEKSKVQASWLMTLRYLWPYQRRYSLPFLVAVLLMGANLLFDVGMGVVQQTFFARMHPGYEAQLLKLVWICGVVGVGLTVLNAVQHFCRYYASAYSDRALALDVLDKINRIPFAWLQKFHSADLVSRVVNDSGLANNLLSSLVYDVMYQVLLGLVALYYLARINLVTAVVSVMVGPVLFGLGRFFDGRIRRISEQIQERDAAVRSKVQESIQEMAAVRAFGLEVRTVEEFAAGKIGQNRLIRRRSVMQSAMWQLVMVAQGSVQVISAVLVAKNALAGNLSPGQVMTFVFLMGNVQSPFMRMSQVWNGIQQSLGAADRLARVRLVPDEIGTDVATGVASVAQVADDEHTKRDSLDTATTPYAIELDQVFYTPGFTETVARLPMDVADDSLSSCNSPLFSGLSLAVLPGETVALVGPSGSGKTTVARLMCGLYRPERGDVRIFGRSMRTNLAEARHLLSYVAQSPYLFSGTIRENIAFGIEEASVEAIERAARMAAAHEFVMKLEEGYDTVIGEQGYRLSGGQRQRIAIARAFLRNSPIIILDEPTSALDNETERTIQTALEQLAQGRTMVIIAHRLSTIRNADRIVVFDKGEIAEQGTHSELKARNGVYAKLVALQTT